MRALEQIISCILAEGNMVVDNDAAEKVFSFLRRAKRTQALSKSERCTHAVYGRHSGAAWLKHGSD
jgi:hypothetical protein